VMIYEWIKAWSKTNRQTNSVRYENQKISSD
jgi:hypothetical protein